MRFRARFVGMLLGLAVITLAGRGLAGSLPAGISVMQMNSGPVAPAGVSDSIISVVPQAAVLLDGVPTSSWTYGCSATSAGMIFGYYDRHGYSNMYAGPANGGVAPLSNLGSACSLIVTQKGFDGRAVNLPGHVDDYWASYGSAGPDPWVGVRSEHVWGDCTADFLGTNQWKWDFTYDGVKDFNTDGSTALFMYSDAEKLYDYIPPVAAGLPQTEVCHGLRLFAESRGYSVLENYTQMIDTEAEGGFSFADYRNEIDAGYPVMIQLDGHTMVGIGYNVADNTVYVHDTWGDYTAQMTWGGTYSGMAQEAVTVLHLAPVPEPSSVMLLLIGVAGLVAFKAARSRNR